MPSSPEPRAGEVWNVDFSPQVGNEQAGIRPALVISNDEFNTMRHNLRIVVPTTGTIRGLPNQVVVEPPEGGLTKVSVLMCEQVKSQSVARFLGKRGEVRPETLERVRRITGLFIQDTP